MWALPPAVLGLHATFGRADTMHYCRRLAVAADPSEMDAVVRARLSLENPRSYGVLADDASNGLHLFVLLSLTPTSHRLEACVWADGADRPAALAQLREWHADAFPTVNLTPGLLESDDLACW